MNLRRKAVSSVKWSGLSIGVATVFQFVTLSVLAHLLSPSDFGLFGMIIVVIGFTKAFTDMGISNAIIYRQDATRDELSSLYWLNVIAGVIVFLIYCCASPLVTAFYHEPRLTKLIYLSSPIFVITAFGQQFQILLQKELLFNKLAQIEIVSSFLMSVVAITLAFLGLGVFSLVWGQLAGTSMRVLLLSWWGCKYWRPKMHFAMQDLKGYIIFGLYQMGEKTVNFLNSNLDYLLIGSMFGAEPLGYYTLAYNIVLKPSQYINSIVNRVAFPVFSKVQNDSRILKRGYLKLLQIISTFHFPLMAGLAVVAPIGVPVIFGQKWLPSIVLIQVLTIVGLLRSTANPVGSLLLSKGRADLGFKWNVAIMISQVPGLYIGARVGGCVGVAVSFAVLMCIYSVFNYIIIIRTILGRCLHEYVRSMVPALWISAVMAIFVLVSGLFLQNIPDVLIMITQILCGFAVYLLLMFYSQRALVVDVKDLLFKRMHV